MALDDPTRLKHILEAARQAMAFVHGRTRADLDADEMLGLALVRLLEIIGEASKGVSPSLQIANRDIPWRKMSTMRDRLIHGYFDVNLDVVWKTILDDLPPLIVQIETLVERTASG
ncbi:MAG: DUF86 domain-containing protein [Phycisphaerales bacterium]|nr:DUF86 domain-containing protein [Phycisphaerales bacterium]